MMEVDKQEFVRMLCDSYNQGAKDAVEIVKHVKQAVDVMIAKNTPEKLLAKIKEVKKDGK